MNVISHANFFAQSQLFLGDVQIWLAGQIPSPATADFIQVVTTNCCSQACCQNSQPYEPSVSVPQQWWCSIAPQHPWHLIVCQVGLQGHWQQVVGHSHVGSECGRRPFSVLRWWTTHIGEMQTRHLPGILWGAGQGREADERRF